MDNFDSIEEVRWNEICWCSSSAEEHPQPFSPSSQHNEPSQSQSRWELFSTSSSFLCIFRIENLEFVNDRKLFKPIFTIDSAEYIYISNVCVCVYIYIMWAPSIDASKKKYIRFNGLPSHNFSNRENIDECDERHTLLTDKWKSQ